MQKRVAWKQRAGAAGRNHVCPFHLQEYGTEKERYGSANLRSSGNVEQFTIEENPELYNFYEEHFSRIVERYATIKKPIRNNALWEEIVRKKFND